MKKFFGMFKIRREEKAVAISALCVLICLHAVMISKTFSTFLYTGGARWTIFIKNFVMSGFDPITYSVVTHWEANYNVYRHPFLSFMVWPLSVLDDWIMELTGLNLVQFIVAVPLLFFGFYTFIFIFRIFRDIVKIQRFEATVLSAMLFSFAYVMVAVIVPDHFCVSLFLLVFALYVSGLKIQNGTKFSIGQTWLLFFVTAGVTLSNGIKIFIYSLFTNGKKFFRLKYFLLAVILPSALIWVFARWEYRTFVLPKEKARKEARLKKSEESRKKLLEAFKDTTSLKDSAAINKAFAQEMNKRVKAKYVRDHQKAWNKHTGKPMGKGEFINWTDVSTSRSETAVENLFGESIQLHDQHLLQDTLRSRPVIVPYSWIINYVVEAVLVLLFVVGIWYGRRSRFLWMALCGFAFDMALHMGLGFGINEVYIMGAHWLFVMPLAMAFMVKQTENSKFRPWLRGLLVVLTLWLWAYNGILLVGYLVG